MVWIVNSHCCSISIVLSVTFIFKHWLKSFVMLGMFKVKTIQSVFSNMLFQLVLLTNSLSCARLLTIFLTWCFLPNCYGIFKLLSINSMHCSTFSLFFTVSAICTRTKMQTKHQWIKYAYLYRGQTVHTHLQN